MPPFYASSKLALMLPRHVALEPEDADDYWAVGL